MNVPQVAIEAILQHLDAKNELNNHLEGLSPTLENKALKELLRDSMAELRESRAEIRDLLLQRDRARMIIPAYTGKRPVIH